MSDTCRYMSPESQWLENIFPNWNSPFLRDDMLVFGGGRFLMVLLFDVFLSCFQSWKLQEMTLKWPLRITILENIYLTIQKMAISFTRRKPPLWPFGLDSGGSWDLLTYYNPTIVRYISIFCTIITLRTRDVLGTWLKSKLYIYSWSVPGLNWSSKI